MLRGLLEKLQPLGASILTVNQMAKTVGDGLEALR